MIVVEFRFYIGPIGQDSDNLYDTISSSDSEDDIAKIINKAIEINGDSFTDALHPIFRDWSSHYLNIDDAKYTIYDIDKDVTLFASYTVINGNYESRSEFHYVIS